ncbi:MAG TPA: hypothetical protein VJ999_11460 [Candidatus Sulfotelmatobacter sp.]|nr:hypothetical protein [Candidatus Sulfotelmatobacter sp.]
MLTHTVRAASISKPRTPLCSSTKVPVAHDPQSPPVKIALLPRPQRMILNGSSAIGLPHEGKFPTFSYPVPVTKVTNLKARESYIDRNQSMWHTDPVKRMTPQDLDQAAARLEEIRIEEERLRQNLLQQVEAFGSSPPRAEKSRRLTGNLYEMTVTRSVTTEIKDAEVERIRQVCRTELFDSLFRPVTKFKLADHATLILAGRLPADAPRNLRAMFSRAVTTKETSPRLRIDKIEARAS